MKRSPSSEEVNSRTMTGQSSPYVAPFTVYPAGMPLIFTSKGMIRLRLSVLVQS